MTFLQMKAVVLSAELGSISLAAKQMQISQSNVSTYIRDVEKELGVKLLIRNRKGIFPTEHGNEFIEHAKKILIEQESIFNINKLKQFYRLRVGAMNFSAARKVFNECCIKYCNHTNLDMLYTNVSLTSGIRMLSNNQIDILIGFIRNDLIDKVDWIVESNNIEKKHLGVMKAYIRFRKNHPLNKTGINKDGTINISLLKNYPYIDYESFKDDDSGFGFNNNFEDGGLHQIYISDENSRYEIMSNSDAYSMGRLLSKEIMTKYDLTCVPIDGLSAEYCALTRKNEANNPILKEYIRMIEDIAALPKK